jgi:hypothetical protein
LRGTGVNRAGTVERSDSFRRSHIEHAASSPVNDCLCKRVVYCRTLCSRANPSCTPPFRACP